MHRPGMISIWFFIGALLLIYGVLILGAGLYDLASPPEGTVWVRVGSDVFLVRSDNGEVIQADYGTFN